MKDISETRRRLWDSLELHCLRRDLILVVIAMAVFMLFAWDDRFWVLALVMDCAFFGPLLVFYLWRGIRIFRKPGSYSFYKTTLARFHQRFPLKAMYFTVVLEEPDGRKRIEETHAIFACHGIVEPLLESYVNRDVTVALNEETGMVVVIG